MPDSTPSLNLNLPGLGLPFEQESHLPLAQNWYASPLTVRERSMLGLMLALKDKPEWDRKVFDESIVEKWRKEALEFSPDQKYKTDSNGEDPGSSSTENGQNLNVDGEERQKGISGEMFDFCIAEMRDDAKEMQEKGFVKAIDANACVYMSDSAVSSETKTRLREGAQRLENVKDWQKDWHPGSDEKVLDLVHPSLFPLLYGRSRFLTSGEVPLEKCAWTTGEGVKVPKPWLPCQVSVNANGEAKITSYINNLYPTANEDLYAAIEQVIAASVPLWIETLLSTQFLATHRIKNDFGRGWILPPEAIERRRRDEEEWRRREEESDSEEYAPYEYDADPPDDYVIAVPQPRDYKPRRRVHDKVFKTGTKGPNARCKYRISDNIPDEELKNPYIEPSKEQLQAGQTGMEEEVHKLRQIFQNQGLQVIVKLANIHLTPEKPTYDGGSWHIEGQLNEHIAASALYYYDSDNITDSYLAFREGVDKDELNDYEQFQYEAYMQIYGIKDSWGSAIQVLGSVHTREERLLVFPNVLQHRVSPFSLADSSRPGHRKLLALFLVDPFILIPSTVNVPPQQREWWAKALAEKGSLTQRLPVELADNIVEGVEDFPITLEEAKELREVLIEERKVFVDDQMAPFVENGYCFCEH